MKYFKRFRIRMRISITLILIFCYTSLLLAFPLVPVAELNHPIMQKEQDSIVLLESFYDADLEQKLESLMNENTKWKKLLKEKKLCIGVVDLKDMKNPRFASLNGEVMMYAASLPKIAVLLAAEDAIEKGEIEHSSTLEKDMRLMISKSDNRATTRIIDQLGYEKIEAVVTDTRYEFYDEADGGGLWVGKRYAAGGPTNREPLKNLSHAATTDQVCRFYYLLINRKLVSPARSEHMLKMLEAPELNHKFVYALKQIDPDAKLYRKSGTWKDWHADSVLVWGNTRRYILVALVQDASGEKIIRDLGFTLDRAIIK